MISRELIKKLARVAVKIGANVQKDQLVGVMGSTGSKELVREIVRESYLVGASRVIVIWRDEFIQKYDYEYRSIKSLEDFPKWTVDQIRYIVDQGGCIININSPSSDILKDVDKNKIQASSVANGKATQFFSNYLMSSKAQWTIISAPNKIWAKKVFPTLDEEKAEEALWDAIFKASRVDENTDPIEEWNKHLNKIINRNKMLNDYKFDRLHLKNKLGTDIELKLVKDHLWVGGKSQTTNNIYFNPNIPTEENFTMIKSDSVNGKVIATKPMSFQGELISDFWLEFKNGEVIDYDAKQNRSVLEKIINTDEGSKRLGEIALINFDSPVSNLDIVFHNTMFDENSSCHMSLGRATPFSIKGGTNMELEELIDKGYNHSLVQADFMFGSPDLKITGITKNNERIEIFANGNFII